jgi:hypothetical protein
MERQRGKRDEKTGRLRDGKEERWRDKEVKR